MGSVPPLQRLAGRFWRLDQKAADLAHACRPLNFATRADGDDGSTPSTSSRAGDDRRQSPGRQGHARPQHQQRRNQEGDQGGAGQRGPPAGGPPQPGSRPPRHFDGSFPVSSAFARALRSVDGVSEAEFVASRAPQRGKGGKAGAPASSGAAGSGRERASDEDYQLLAEVIEAYLLAAGDTSDPRIDAIGPVERALLEGIAATVRDEVPPPQAEELHSLGLEGDSPLHPRVLNLAPPGRLPWECLAVDEEAGAVHWAVDLTDGRAADPWRNARLSDEAKALMHAMHKRAPQGEGAVPALAARFRIREQRVMAILALKEMEAEAEAASAPLHEELRQLMEEEVHSCSEASGSGERHHVTLPSFPAYAEVDPEQVIQRLEAVMGRPAEEIREEDLTAEVAKQVLGVRRPEEVEAELAAKEEADAVLEFRRRLEFNLGKAGAGLRRENRRSVAARRPKGGWPLAVTPLGQGKEGGSGEREEAYVALPDGSRRALTRDEVLVVERKTPRPRRRAL